MEALIDIRRDARKIGGVLAALLALNVIFFLAVVRPRAHESSVVENERDSFDSDLAAATKRTEALRSIDGRIEEQVKGLERFYGETLGTKFSKMVVIEREIATICSEFNIDPQEVRYNTVPVADARVERFVIRLPLLGDYSNLRRFIERVENSKNFLVIDRVALSNTKEGGSTLQLNIEVATYFDAPWLAELQKKRLAPRRRSQT